MLKNTYNPTVSRMSSYITVAIKGDETHKPCAEEIIPFINDFFNACTNLNIKWNNSNLCTHIESITKVVMFLAQNTQKGEKLSTEDIEYIQKIFEELISLKYEALSLLSCESTDFFSKKVFCISEIISGNIVPMHVSRNKHDSFRDKMIFQNYESLWKIVHRVNTEWFYLCKRGFSLKVFHDYRSIFMYHKNDCYEISEEQKLETFMNLLDGKMKLVPVYVMKPVYFQAVDNDSDDKIVIQDYSFSSSYRMLQANEITSD